MRLSEITRIISRQRIAGFTSFFFASIVGFILRFHNITPYIQYPDGYQNLIVAQHISHGLLSRLGQNGMTYPGSLELTRPIYPALIALVHLLTHASYLTAGHAVSLIASILTIPLSYFVMYAATRRKLPAVLGALLIATSFSSIVWSGYTMTESTGNVVLLLLLLALFKIGQLKNIRQKNAVIPGLLLGLCFLTRYEYFLLLIPTAIYLAKTTKWQAMVTILAVPYVIAILFIAIFLRNSGLHTIMQSFGPLFLGTLVGLLLVWIANKKADNLLPQINAKRFAFGICAVMVIIMVLAFCGIISYSALYNFESHDFVITSLAVIGLYILLRKRSTSRLGMTLLLSLVLLALAYARLDNAMWRYLTHLIPLLVIAAAIGAEGLIYSIARARPPFRLLTAFAVAVIFMCQLVTSYNGLHTWDGGIWFQQGYEQLSAKELRPFASPSDVIVTAVPEPYFFITQVSTIEATTIPPFISNSISPNRELIIVEDAYLDELYPNFSHLLSDNLREYKTTSYHVSGVLRFGGTIVRKPESVTIYKLDYRQYMQAIGQAENRT